MVNAYFKSSNKVEKRISNLAHSPFVFEGRECLSFEGFYQGIKRSSEEMQNHVFQTFGLNAKKQSKPTKFIYFNGRKLQAGRKEHHELLLEAQIAKYTQHEKSKEALLSTGNSKITHNVGRDSPLYPAKVYCKHLTTVRTMLQKGEI